MSSSVHSYPNVIQSQNCFVYPNISSNSEMVTIYPSTSNTCVTSAPKTTGKFVPLGNQGNDYQCQPENFSCEQNQLNFSPRNNTFKQYSYQQSPTTVFDNHNGTTGYISNQFSNQATASTGRICTANHYARNQSPVPKTQPHKVSVSL